MPAPLKEEPILEATLRVMTERGYVGATTKLIAEEADIGEITLFRKFGTKDNLILEAMKREAAKLKEETIYYTGNLKADMTRFAYAYNALQQSRLKLMLTFVTEVMRHPELGGVIELPYQVMQAMCKVIERYQDEGQLKREEPFQQLTSLLGPILMFNILKTVKLQETTQGVDIEAQVERFLSGCAMMDESKM